MKKPRTKKYSPRPIRFNAMDWAIAGVHKMVESDRKAVLAPVLEGVDRLRQGKATRAHWNDVCESLNVAEALAELHIGDNLLPDFNAGHEALHQVALRMLAGGSSTCRASELAAIREAVELYALQLTLCTQAELSRAVRRVKALMDGGALNDVARTYAKLNGATS